MPSLSAWRRIAARRNARCGSFLSANLENGRLDGLKNLEIPRATAKIAGERFADVVAIGMRILIQQCFRGHKNRRRAISALGCTQIGEGLLQGMKMAICCEAFDGQNALVFALERKHETREHRLAVQKNGAGTTFSQFAAVFGAGMAKVLAKKLKESF